MEKKTIIAEYGRQASENGNDRNRMEMAEGEAGMNGKDSCREGMEVTRIMEETKIDFRGMEMEEGE
jgi:hypothetical protein